MGESPERAGLKRALGWPVLAAYGLGSILGAGIYSVIGAAAARAGDAMWMSFGLSALVALFTALSYAELATMYPRAGAEFLYVHHALPRQGWAAFTVGMMMAVSTAATAATVSISFGGYLASFAGTPTPIVASLLVIVLAAVAIAGVKESVGMMVIFTIIEAAGLVAVVVLGATSARFGAAFRSAPTLDVLPGAALVFFSYLGFQSVSNLAEETKRPEVSLPRALLVSLAVSTLLYILVAVAVLALIPASELARSDAPLADAVRARSASMAGALGGIALFATANTALAALITGSRILYAMAVAGELPPALASVLPRRRTPWVATVAIAAAALTLLPLGSIGVVASISSFASLVAFAAVSTALIILRYREPETARPFRVPLAIGSLPVLPLIGGLSALFLITQLDARVLAYGAILIMVAFAVYVSLKAGRRRVVGP